MKFPDARLLLLSKAPEPGQVKTRLIPLLGATAAAGLYADLVQDCLKMCVSARLCPVEVWCSPSVDHPFFLQCYERYRTVLHTQAQGDIGQRMSRAIQVALQQARHVVLIGADCPTLTVADIDEAFTVLGQGTDVVLGPAVDGGYYLIGMNAHHNHLFEEMPWSTPELLIATEKRLRALGLGWHRLPVHRDLDNAEDYAVYQAGRIRPSMRSNTSIS